MMYSSKLVAVTSAVALLMCASVGFAEEPTLTEAPATTQKVQRVALPLNLDKDVHVVYRVKTGAESNPADAPEAARDGEWSEYRIQVRKVEEDRSTLAIAVRDVPRVAQDETEDAESDGAAETTPAPEIVVEADEDGHFHHVSGAKLTAEQRGHVQLILGSGLHQEKLKPDTPYAVAGYEMELLPRSKAAASDQVVFAVMPKADATSDARPSMEEGTRTSRATYDTATGLLASLEIDAPGGETGMQSLVIRRVAADDAADAREKPEEPSSNSRSTCNPDAEAAPQAR